MFNTFMKRRRFIGAVFTCALLAGLPSSETRAADNHQPTIVLVHGAFADSSSWREVIPALEAKGFHVISAANPLRSLTTDAAAVGALLDSIPEDVVLVGHSYGGSVITAVAGSHRNVKALVYVAALAPDKGESAFDLVGKFSGSKLGEALATPVNLPDGSHDLFVSEEKFAEPLAADLEEKTVSVLAATQRPVTDVALKQASPAAAWKKIPSWFVFGAADASIPAVTHEFMAKRASAKETVAIPGASHLVMLSHAPEVAQVIEDAANGVAK